MAFGLRRSNWRRWASLLGSLAAAGRSLRCAKLLHSVSAFRVHRAALAGLLFVPAAHPRHSGAGCGGFGVRKLQDKTDQASLYAEVTSLVIAKLEAGPLPWVRHHALVGAARDLRRALLESWAAAE